MKMASKYLVGVAYIVALCTAVLSQSWNHNVEYFKSVTLNCTGDVNDTVKLWILPSGDVIDAANTNNNIDKHIHMVEARNGLHISRVDDPDFGLYFCVIESPGGEVKVIKKGINLDGPYYSPDITDRYKKNAVIGGVAGGVMLIVFLSLWIMCKCGKSRSTVVLKPTENDANGAQMDVQVLGMNIKDGNVNAVNATDINPADGSFDINIYDQADSLEKRQEIEDSLKTSAFELETKLNIRNVNHRDSCQYQSIADVDMVKSESTPTQLQMSDLITSERTIDEGMGERFTDWNDVTGRHITSTDSIAHNGTMSSAATLAEGRGFIIVSESFTRLNDSADILTSDDASVSVIDDDVIYAKPIKSHRRQGAGGNDMAQTIEGDIVLESNGAKVVVTSSPNTSVVQSPLEEYLNEKASELRIPSVRE